MKLSYEAKISIIFFSLIFTYVAKFSKLVDFDITAIYWSLAAIYSAYRVGTKILLVNICTYLILLIFYLIGAHDNINTTNADYEKNIFAFSIFSSLLVQFIKEKLNDKRPNTPLSKLDMHLIYFIYALISFWIFLVITASATQGDYVVREYGGANYLTPSDLLAMLTLSLIGGRRIDMISAGIYIAITVMALFVLGSRASIILFVLCCTFIIEKKYIKKSLISIALYMSIIYIAFTFADSFDGEMFFRLKSIFDLAGDESRDARNSFFNDYIKIINKNQLCIALPCQPAPGDYVHNIISIHQYFGLIVFAAFFIALILATLVAIKNKYIFFPLFSYTILQNIFFRSWHSFTFPVLISLIICIFMRHGLFQRNSNGISS